MSLIPSWMIANVEVEAIPRGAEPAVDVRLERALVLVGTEVRWINGSGNPCAINATGAIRQERFSITTEWKEATDG